MIRPAALPMSGCAAPSLLNYWMTAILRQRAQAGRMSLQVGLRQQVRVQSKTRARLYTVEITRPNSRLDHQPIRLSRLLRFRRMMGTFPLGPEPVAR